MKASFITVLLSLATVNALALPQDANATKEAGASKEAATADSQAVEATGQRGRAAGPFSFIIESDDERFHGKWLAPGTADKDNAPAILSKQRFRTFFISANQELTFTQAPSAAGESGIRKFARLQDWIQTTPLLAQVTFQKEEIASNGVVRSEQSFGTSNDGYFSVRGGKAWYACTAKKGAEDRSDDVKILAKGTSVQDKNCAQIKLMIVDGLA